MYQAGIAIRGDASGAVGALSITETQVKSLTKSVNSAAKEVGLLATVSKNELATALGLTGLVDMARRAINAADTVKDLRGQIKALSDTSAEYRSALAGINSITKDTYSSLEATGTLYARVTRAIQENGASQKDALTIVRAVNNALLAGRASTTEAAAAQLQLAQAFAKGKLNGDEFASLAENAPGILTEVARALGVNKDALYDLAEAGEITDEVLTRALTGAGSERLAQQAANVPLTVGRAWQGLKNDLLNAIGDFDEAAGASAALASVVQGLGTVVSALIPLIGTGVAVALGKSVGALGQYARAQVESVTSAVRSANADVVAKNLQIEASRKVAEAGLVQAQAVNGVVAANARQAESELALAKIQLDSARREVLRATRMEASAKAAGAQSFALRTLAEAEQRVAFAMAERARAEALVSTTSAVHARNAEILALSNGRVATAQGAVDDASKKTSASVGLMSRAMTGAAAAGSAVLSFLGGWVGIAAIAAIGIYALTQRQTEFGEIAEDNTKVLQRLSEATDANRAAAQREAQQSIDSVKAKIEETRARLAAAQAALKEAENYRSLDPGDYGPSKGGAQAEVTRLTAAVKELTPELARLEQGVFRSQIATTQFGRDATVVFDSVAAKVKLSASATENLFGAVSGLVAGIAQLRANAASGDDFIGANADSVKKQIAAYNEQVATMGRGQAALAQYKLQVDLAKVSTDAQRDALRAQYEPLIAAATAVDAVKAAQDRATKATQAATQAAEENKRKQEEIKRSAEQASGALQQMSQRLAAELGGASVQAAQRLAEATATVKAAEAAWLDEARAKAINNGVTAEGLKLVALTAAQRKILNTVLEQANALHARDMTAIREKLSASQETLKSLDEEIFLLGLSTEARATEEIAIRAIDAAKRESKPLSLDEIETLKEQIRTRLDVIKSLREHEKVAEETKQTVTGAFNSMADAVADFAVGNIKSLSDLGEAMKSIWRRAVADMISQAIKLNVIKPILDSIFNPKQSDQAGGGFLGNLVGSIFGSGSAASSSGGLGGLLGSLLGGSSGSSSGGLGGLIGSLLGAGSGSSSGLGGLIGSLLGGSSASSGSGLGGWMQSIGSIFSTGFGGGASGGLLGTLGSLFSGGGAATAGAGLTGVLGSVVGGISSVVGSVGSALSAVAGAIPGIGWVMAGVAAVSRLIKTKWKVSGSSQNVSFNEAGVSGNSTVDETGRRLFGRTRTRSTVTQLDASALEAPTEFWTALSAQVRDQARLVGSAIASPISFSFKTEFDKAGKQIAQYGIVLGQRVDGTFEEIQARVSAESTIAVVASVAGSSVEQIAARYRSSVEALTDVAQLLLQAQADVTRGAALLGEDVQLDVVTALVERNRQSGESLVQTYVRLAGSAEVMEDSLSMLGIEMDLNREAFVQFAADVASASGGLDAARSLFASFNDAFYTESERLLMQVDRLRSASDTQLGALGVPTDVSMVQFRAIFEQVLPTLSAEATVTWLRAASALSQATAAQDALNAKLTAYTDFIAGVRAELSIKPTSAYQQARLEIAQWETQAVRTANTLARAAGLQGAAEDDLAVIHTVAARRARAALETLQAATRDLVARLYGTVAEASQTELGNIDAVGQASDDRYSRELDNIRAIHDFARSLTLDQRLTTLTPLEQLDEAAARYRQLFAQAQAGDLDAQAQLTDAARAYLELARQAYSSGDQYTAIFNEVRSALLGFSSTGAASNTQPAVAVSAVGTESANVASAAASSSLERLQLAGELIGYLRDFAQAIGVDVLKLAEDLGIPLSALVADLGINLSALTAETTASLADVATAMGAELSQLASGLGVNLGELADRQSLINNELEARILALPLAQRERLEPLFRALEAATTDADANAALSDLEAATALLPAELRNEFAPFFRSITVVSPELDYLSSLDGINDHTRQSAVSLTDILAEVQRIGSLTTNPPNASAPTPAEPPVAGPLPSGPRPRDIDPREIGNPNQIQGMIIATERNTRVVEELIAAQRETARAIDRQTDSMAVSR